MAELLIKTRPGAGYEDGDVLCAFNARRISQCHAENICHVKRAGRTTDGLRPINSLARHLRERLCQYRFERISRRKVRRVDIETGESVELSDVPVVVNGKRQHMDVPLFVARRLKYDRHGIFGQKGQEVWYGGRYKPEAERLARVWDTIEDQSDDRRDDEARTLWPMGRLDVRHHLAVRVVDFSDAEAGALVAPQYERDEDGELVLDDDERPIRVAKRNIKVDWRADLLPDLDETEAHVMDRDFPVGREAVVSSSRFWQSKPQPAQEAAEKLWNKSEQRPGQRGGD